MSKTIESFKKVARIIVVICLFVLAAFQIINLINIIGSTFFADLVLVLRAVLMMLVYLVPAILLAVKKDKEGFVVLSFLLGYLLLARTISFISMGAGLDIKNLEALDIIRMVIFFILGIFLALVLVCFLLDKGFKLHAMKLGNILLVISMIIILICAVVEVIVYIVNDVSFAVALQDVGTSLLEPLVAIFGLILVSDKQ